MNRWAVRIVGILMLLVFLLLFMNLQKKLIELRRQQGTTATSR